MSPKVTHQMALIISCPRLPGTGAAPGTEGQRSPSLSPMDRCPAVQDDREDEKRGFFPLPWVSTPGLSSPKVPEDILNCHLLSEDFEIRTT